MESGEKALNFMAQQGISLHPRRYAVWYEYYLGANEELVADLNHLLEDGYSLSSRVHEYLYDKYFCDKHGRDTTQKAMDETQAILRNFLEILMQIAQGSVEDQKALGQYSAELQGAQDLSQVQHLLELIADRSHRMAASSRDLQQRLEHESARTEKLRALLEQTKRDALIDALTGLYNRNALDRKIAEMTEALRADGSPFSLLMLDVDNFKRINDAYGHTIGDAVLRVAGKTIAQNTKGSDFAARYGGEEFAVTLPRTPLDRAVVVAENIRRSLEANRFKVVHNDKTLPAITISIGITLACKDDTPEALFERADKALYQAKSAGRNTVRTIEVFQSANA